MKSNTCLYTTLPIQHTLGTLVEEKYCNRDLILPSVELAFNNSVNHCTGKSQLRLFMTFLLINLLITSLCLLNLDLVKLAESFVQHIHVKVAREIFYLFIFIFYVLVFLHSKTCMVIGLVVHRLNILAYFLGFCWWAPFAFIWT